MFMVRFVEEESLPPEQAWVIGVTSDGLRFILIKRGAVICPSMWEELWQYGHHLTDLPVAV